MPMSYGGGINNIDDAKRILNSGFEKVSLNMAFMQDIDIIRNLSKMFGSQSIMVSIDVKKNIFGKYKVYNYIKENTINMGPLDYALQAEKMGAGEILLNLVDRDGTMEGYDIDLIKYISKEVDIPVVALGGAGKLNDFSKAINIGGASAVAAGSMFVFQGIHRAVLITYPNREELDKIVNG